VKKIFSLIKDHLRQDFQLNYYLSIALFLGVSVAINYWIDLENKWIDRYTGKLIRIPLYFLLNAIGYYVACLIVSRFTNEKQFWRVSRFWFFSVFGLLIISIDHGFPYLNTIVSSLDQPYAAYFWIYKIGTNLTSFALVLLPLYIFYKTFDKQKSGFYGLSAPGNIRPYIVLLIIVAPIILLASMQKGFTDYYPIYKTNTVAELWHWPFYLPMLLFEIAYGADFLNVELLFRGFFVIGMAQVLGKNSVIPMVVIYCFLHFGKPAGEAISSIFGGYVLGVIALNTKSIWGGIIAHVGVAWLMEAGAYFAKQF
jgi:hypothetical protein